MNIFEKILRHFGYVKQEHEAITEKKQIQSHGKENNSDVINKTLLPVPVITQFSLNSANKSTTPVVFEKLQSITLPEGFECIPMSKVARQTLFDVVSSGMGLGTTGMLIQNGLNGLYQATAPVSQLMKLSSGGIGSAMIGENGRIIAQKGFVQASGAAFTPIIVFQVLSMVTGQYYMNGITKQLNALNEKIDSIINKIESSYQGKLQSTITFFQILARQNSYSMDDLVLLRMRLIEIQDMYNNYIIQMRKSAEMIKQKWCNRKFNYTDAGELLSALSIVKASDFFYLNDMAQGISVTYQIGELIYVKLLSKLGSDSLSLDKLNEILLSFNELTTESKIHIHQGIHQELKEYFVPRLSSCANNADYKYETSQRRYSEIQKLFTDSEDCYNSQTQNEIKQIQQATYSQFNKPEELLFDCSQTGEVYVFKRKS